MHVVVDYRDGEKQRACHALYSNDRILCQVALKVSTSLLLSLRPPVPAVMSCDEPRQAVIATED